MKSALSLTLIMCLVAPALPAAAQGGKPAESDWSRVRKLAPGTEILVTVQGSQSGRRYAVLADESNLKVLNLTDPTLPRAATRVLLNMASYHPEYFSAMATAGAFVDGNVRVGPAGVFVAGRKVADFGQVVEHIARDNIVEIQQFVRTGGSVVRTAVWATAGLFGGAMVGGAIGGGLSCAFGACGPTKPNIPPGVGVGIFAGAVVGTIWGGSHGYRSGRRTTQELIYHAP